MSHVLISSLPDKSLEDVQLWSKPNCVRNTFRYRSSLAKVITSELDKIFGLQIKILTNPDILMQKLAGFNH